MGPEAVPIAGAIAKSLADSDAFVRWGAARTLVRLAPGAPAQTVPALAKALEDANGDVVRTAFDALQHYGPLAVEAVPALRKAAERGKPEMRVLAIRTLGSIGHAGKDAVPTLVSALKADKPTVRAAAAAALGRIGAQEEALSEALNDPDMDVRRAAADSLLAAP
jgi:HEAT repeat protein